MYTALPLGISTTMAALNLNMPRYFIHAQLGERQLGIYSAMAYTTVAMILVADSLGHCAIPRLSRLYSAGRTEEFRALLFKLLAAGGGLGLAGLAAARILGVRLLTTLYGHEYAAHYQVFLILILATAIHCVASMFTSAVTSAMFPDSGAALRTGRGIERTRLCAMGAWFGDGGRRRGNGGSGVDASGARRRGCGLAVA
jgi:O-antigen/teichoic acid export membrane protein